MTGGSRRSAPALPSHSVIAVALALLMLSTVSLTQAASAVYLTTSFAASNAGVTTSGGFRGVEITYTNNLNTSETPLIYAVFVNNASEVVGVSVLGGYTLSPGANGTYFASFQNLPGGNYNMVFLVTTPDFVPLSAPTTVPITL